MKLTSRPSRNDLDGLNRKADLIAAEKRILVCRRSEFLAGDNAVICDLDGLLELATSAGLRRARG